MAGNKVGRPRKNNSVETIFVGLQMPKAMSVVLKKDASKHFRMRGQHILWILSDYIVRKVHFKGISSYTNVSEKRPVNQPIYTEQEMEEMYKAKKRGEL